MRLRNGEHGYGAVTKTLHWLTVLAFAAQFWVGYTMASDDDVRKVDCGAAGERRSGGDTTDAEKAQQDRLEDQCEARQDRLEDEAEDAVATAWSDLGSGDLATGGLSRPEVHVLLGLSLIALGVLRLIWRRTTGLPPWDPRLSTTDQRVVHATEVSLLTLQFVVPATGIMLVVGSDDLVTLHIAAHLAFFTVLACHLVMVIGKGLLPRMLPGR